MPSSLADLFRDTKLVVAEGHFTLVGATTEAGIRSLTEFDDMRSDGHPFMRFQDGFERTFLFHETDWNDADPSSQEYSAESGFRLVTIDRELSWDVVGFLARVTHCLADAGISVGVLSSFSRDHLLIKDAELEKALAVLNELIRNSGGEATDGTVLDR